MASQALCGEGCDPGARPGAKVAQRDQVVDRNCMGPIARAHPSGWVGSAIAARPGEPSMGTPTMGGDTSPVRGSARPPAWRDSIQPMPASTVQGRPEQ